MHFGALYKCSALDFHTSYTWDVLQRSHPLHVVVCVGPRFFYRFKMGIRLILKQAFTAIVFRKAVGVRLSGYICDRGSKRPIVREHVILANPWPRNKTTPREPIIAIQRETAWQRGVSSVRSGRCHFSSWALRPIAEKLINKQPITVRECITQKHSIAALNCTIVNVN